nr:hypothetical protein [uncultured Undibacterium sp.]
MNRVRHHVGFVAPGLLEINHVYSEELEKELEENSPGSDSWSIATEELIQWYVNQWQRVGGENFPLVPTMAASDAEFNA